MELSQIGWSSFFEAGFAPYAAEDLVPARVIREDRGRYLLLSTAGEWSALVSGAFRHSVGSRCDFPAVGDWVACTGGAAGAEAVIRAVLPRRGCFRRKEAGARTEAQVVAANVDTVFVVSGLDGGRNFNLRRIERYLVLCRESAAAPVAVLNKADLCEARDSFVAQVRTIAAAMPVHVVSAVTGEGIGALLACAGPGRTLALLGPSGVGKSALINAMLGAERLVTGEVRADDRRGRHTTTRRELFFLPNGGMVIDTPGMRELQLWGDDESLSKTFADVEELARQCRFRDCRHLDEEGCAVRQAIGEGTLDAARYDSYLRLQRELAHLARRRDEKTRSNPKARWKDIAKRRRELKKQSRLPDG
ncbi:MAG: ribosome small subunit-dependent GTPase A [Kiritimatiellae bacterium]|nr:ribosome small subunit-dependent GTPase A [Kiritimatiellia bacterium]